MSAVPSLTSSPLHSGDILTSPDGISVIWAQPAPAVGLDADLIAIAALTHAKGSIIAAGTTDWTSLGVGTNGQVLTADSTQATGLKWGALNTGLVIGTDIEAWDADLDAIAALSHTKGNLIVGGAAAWSALAIGTDTYRLVADSTQATGAKWLAPEGPMRWTWGLGVGTPLVVANDVTLWLVTAKAGTFTRVDLVAKTGPTGAAVIVDIKKSSNGGSTFTSLWNVTTANRPTIAAGSKVGTFGALDTTAFSAGDILRIDIIQVGSTVAGQDVTVQLLGTMAQ